MTTTTIRTIQLPPSYYETRQTIGGGEVRDLMPDAYEGAEYVTDGEQYGLRFEDQVDWLGTSVWIDGEDGQNEVTVSDWLAR